MTEQSATLKKLSITTRIAVILAIAACAVMIVSMAIKPISAVDLGYHLAYGCKQLDTGKIVDSAMFISPVPTEQNAATDEYPLAPGAKFDSEGKYYFPNANWLTQLILAVCWRSGRWAAMNFLLIWLIVMIAAGQFCAVKSLKISPLWAAACWLALAFIGYERFLLRPELFAFAVLIWQFALLLKRKTNTTTFTIVLLLQLLAANLHSYWLLGAAIAGAFAFESFLHFLSPKMADEQIDKPARRRNFIFYAVLTLCMTLIAGVHPTGLPNILYPVKTLRYVSRHRISGLDSVELTKIVDNKYSHKNIDEAEKLPEFHPWQIIGEFHNPLSEKSREALSCKSFVVLLGAAAVAASVLVCRRQWALLMVILAMCMAGKSMRRNIIIPAIITAPVIIWAFIELLRLLLRSEKTRLYGKIISAIIFAAAAIILSVSVFNSSFYYKRGRLSYFGTGANEMSLPLGSCRALEEIITVPQSVFANQNLTSSLVFFSQKATSVSTLTNTWACPPKYFEQSFGICTGKLPYEQIEQMGHRIAIIQAWPENVPLIQRLNLSDRWALVDISGSFCTFVLREGLNADDIDDYEIFHDNFDSKRILDSLPVHPIAKAMQLQNAASSLQHMKWFDCAAEIWQQCVKTPVGAKIAKNWLNLGTCLAIQNAQKAKLGDKAAIEQLIAARRAFAKALELEKDYPEARKNLARVDADLKSINRLRMIP